MQNKLKIKVCLKYREIGYWKFLFRAKGLGVMWVLMGYFEVVLMYYYN